MKLFALLIALFAFNASAYQCVEVDVNGYLQTSSDPDSSCSLVLMSKTEYETSNIPLVVLLEDLFKFDPELFSRLYGHMIVTFVTAFGAGFTVRWLGKR